MTQGPLVDTGVLIDYFGGIRNAESDLLDDLLEHGPPPGTAPIIVQEFLLDSRSPGISNGPGSASSRSISVEPPDYDVHRSAAALHVGLKRKGLTTSSADALIVASAESAGRPLLTRDKAQRALADHAGVSNRATARLSPHCARERGVRHGRNLHVGQAARILLYHQNVRIAQYCRPTRLQCAPSSPGRPRRAASV